MLVKNVVPNKLHDELIKANINCSIQHNLEDGRYFVGDCEISFFGDVDLTAVQAIIDAHNSTPLPPQQEPTEQQQLNAQLLLENANLKKQIAEQQKLNASVLLDVAKLKGGI